MTKYAIITICIGLVVSSCNKEELASSIGSTAHDEVNDGRIRFGSPGIFIGAPATGGIDNVGTLRTHFEEGERLGAFGVRCSAEESGDYTLMDSIDDESGFHFFNLPLTFTNSQETLSCDEHLFMPGTNNLLVYSYYPYTDAIVHDEANGWGFYWNIDRDAIDETPDYLLPQSPAHIASVTEPVEFGTMRHVFGAMAIRFCTPDESLVQDINVSSIRGTLQYPKTGFISVSKRTHHFSRNDFETISNSELPIPDGGVNVTHATSADEAQPSVVYVLPPDSYIRMALSATINGRSYTIRITNNSKIIEAGKMVYFNFVINSGTRTKGSGEQLEIETSVTTEDWNESN